MKRLYIILISLVIITSSASSQIKYDDGPIVTGGAFVTEGTWGRSNITFSFQNGTSDIAGDDERNAVRQAFQIWADYSNLTFTEVTTNADIAISWGTANHGDGFPFDGVNGVLAHAFFPPPNGGSYTGDIHFDDAETWTMAMQSTSAQPMDSITVAAHEIGHALGLGHSNVTCALMNPFYTGSHRYLSQDDIDGIQSIYGNRTVVRTTNLTCSGGNFSISNLPVGASVFWSSSNTSVASVVNSTNQGIVARVGSANGNVRITATITLPCGTSIVEFMDIAIGAPDNTQLSVWSSSNSVCPNLSMPFVATFANRCNLLNAEWQVSPSNAYITYNNGFPCPNENNTGVTISFPYSGSYSVKTRVQNSCGWSLWSQPKTIQVTCSGAMGYLVAPNPATSTVTVQQKEKTNADINEVRIFDNSGNLKRQAKYASGSKQAQINISDLTNGIYYIEITSGERKERQQLIIQK